MGWKALKRVNKKYRVNFFNFFWLLFLLGILSIWLFKIDSKSKIIIDQVYDVPALYITVENGQHLNQQLESVLNQIKKENESLTKEIESFAKLEAKFESLDKSIDMISNHIGLFGVLITVISIFFSLRESSRIDEYIEKYEDEIERYRNELDSLDEKIKTHFDLRKEELSKEINTIVMNRFKSIKKDLMGNSDNKFTSANKIQDRQNSNRSYLPYKQKNMKNRNLDGITSNCRTRSNGCTPST